MRYDNTGMSVCLSLLHSQRFHEPIPIPIITFLTLSSLDNYKPATSTPLGPFLFTLSLPLPELSHGFSANSLRSSPPQLRLLNLAETLLPPEPRIFAENLDLGEGWCVCFPGKSERQRKALVLLLQGECGDREGFGGGRERATSV